MSGSGKAARNNDTEASERESPTLLHRESQKPIQTILRMAGYLGYWSLLQPKTASPHSVHPKVH